ncbi:MAG: hypothetical protein R8G66_24815 [Cytophagales bacterium]|nr:hypothetical protein [Cytophagales bacterium]
MTIEKHVKVFRAFVALIALFLLSCHHQSDNKPIPMMGDLKMGAYRVGYRTLFEYDRTRPGIPYSDWEGKLYRDHDPALGRQFQIHVWYPATGEGDPMRFEQYVHLMGRETNFGESEEQEKFAEERFIQQTNDLGGEGKFTTIELAELLEMQVFAEYGAHAETGPFPVVIIPSGCSAAYHSITAEFLASHGFVVVGFSPKGRFSWGMEISTLGLETAVDDLEFVVQQISNLPYVNVQEISLAGNAISSSVCALALAKNSQFKALISLEGGLPSSFEQRLLNQTQVYAPQNLQVPMLFIYAPHPSIDPSHTFHLVHSDRYYAHFPKMSEFAMLNYGMFDAVVPDIIGEHEGGTKSGFETANKLMLRFLNNVHGKLDEPLFTDDFAVKNNAQIDTTFILTSVPAAPNLAEMKVLFLERGMMAIDSIYQTLQSQGSKSPFSTSFYRDYRSWLAWKRDPEFSNRLQLYEMAYGSFPESSEVNYYLAAYLERTGDTLKAIHHYERTLQLLVTDEDPALGIKRKGQIRQYAQEALEILR